MIIRDYDGMMKEEIIKIYRAIETIPWYGHKPYENGYTFHHKG